MPELKDFLNAINTKASKWYIIGLNLDLTTDELDIIEKDGRCVEERLRKMLKKCLSRKRNNSSLTWTALIEALRQPSVAEEVLASQLEKQYLSLRNDKDINTPSQRQIVEIKQEKSEASRSTPKSPTKAEEGIALLEEKYRTIGTKLGKTLKQNGVTIDDLQLYGATLPISVQKKYKKLKKRPSPLAKVTSISDFIATVNTYSNILNPDLLKDAVKELGDKETKELMADYIDTLHTFRQTTQLKELMGKWKRETPPSYHRLVMTLGDNWKEKTLEELEEVKGDGWLLEMIVDGSVVLVFSTPELIDLEDDSFREFLQSCDGVLSVHVEASHVQEAALEVMNSTSLANERQERTGETTHDSTGTTPIAPSQSDKALVELKITNLKALFKDVLMNFRQTMIQSRVSVQTLEDYINHLPLTVNQHYKDLLKQPTSLAEEPNAHIDCFVDALATYTFILNPTLLTNAIKEYGDEQTTSDMNIYMSNLGEFQKSTKLVDLIGVWNGEAPPHHKQVTIESQWEDKLLYDLIQVLVAARAFGWHLVSIDRGVDCLKIVFSAQQPVSISKGIQDFLHPYGVLRIQLEGEPLIDLDAPPVDISPKEEKAFILPDVIQFGFHRITGQNITLSEDSLEAERKDHNNDFDTSVYSAKPFEGTTEFEVEITKLRQSVFGGTLQIGIKWWKSGNEISSENLPRWSVEGDDYCIWYYGEIWNKFEGELKKSRYGIISPNEIQQGGTLGMRVTHTGELVFIVNGRNQGVAAKNVYREGYDVYAVLDIRRRCFAVKITRAVMRSGDFSLQELCIEEVARAIKSSEQVKELPLPQVMKKEIEKYVAEH